MNFPKIYLVCAFILFGADAGAADVKVDNGETLTGAQIQSIQIDPATNVLHILTVSGNYTIAPAETNPNDPVVNLLVNGGTSATVTTGTEVTLSWTVSNAVSCDTTGGNTAWQNYLITPSGGTASGSFNTTITSESTQTYNLNCIGEQGTNPGSDSVNITGVAPGLPAVTLLVNGLKSTTVAANTVVNISWNISNSSSCTTSGGTAEWRAKNIFTVGGSASGSMNITVDFSQTTQFAIECTTTPNSASDFVTVSVESSCPVAPLATDLTAQQQSALIKSWSGIFGGIWPDPPSASKAVAISRSRYMAIEFNTGNNSSVDGGLRTVTAVGTTGSRLGAISQCPGDFKDFLASNACKKSWYIGGTLSWTTSSNPLFYECKLEPNTTYYFNLTFTDGQSTSTDSCVGSQCITTIDYFRN